MSRRAMFRSPRRSFARRADNRRRRLAIEPLEDRRMLAMMNFQDGENQTIGSDLVDRSANDIREGQAYIYAADTFAAIGVVSEWSFFDNDGSGRNVTPLVLQVTDDNGVTDYTVRGIGRTVTSNAGGVQTQIVDIVAGSGFVLPGQYTFGLYDGAVNDLGGGTISLGSTNRGVVDNTHNSPLGDWVFTPTQSFTLSLGTTFSVSPDLGEVQLNTNGDGSNANRTYSAEMTIVDDGDYSIPLVPLDPLGSLVYVTQGVRGISSPGETDTFQVAIDGGQNVTIIIDPFDGLQSAIQWHDSGGTLVGSASAAAAGETLVLQNVPIVEAGTYTMTVTGLGGTTGHFDGRVLLNAAVEVETHGGNANDSMGTAQDIEPTLFQLTDGIAQRGAVVGANKGDDDWYRFALADGESAMVALSGLAGGAPAVELYDVAGTRLAMSAVGADGLVHIGPFSDASSDGRAEDYFIRIIGGGATDLPVTDGMVLNLDAMQIEQAAGTRVSQWDDLSGRGNHASISFGDPTLVASRINGQPAVQFDGDDYLRTATQFGSQYTVFSVATLDGGRNGRLVSSGSVNWLMGYWMNREGVFYAGGWVVNDCGVAGVSCPPDTKPDLYVSTSTAGGQSKRLFRDGALIGGPNGAGGNTPIGSLELGSSLGSEPSNGSVGEIVIYNRVLTADELDDVGLSLARKWGLDAYGNPNPGVAAGLAAPSDDYTLVVTRNAQFAVSEPGMPQDLTIDGVLLGHLDRAGENTSQDFTVGVVAGDVLEITTSTPADGLGEFVNLLDPRIELYDPSGRLIGSDDDGAGDGRNASLARAANKTGRHTIRILSTGATAGEFVLNVTGHSGSLPAFTVASIDPEDGAVSAANPAAITLEFSDTLLLASLDATDLTIDGVPARRFDVLDHDTVQFLFSEVLSAGDHTVSLSDGAMIDLQGTAVDALTSTFSIARELSGTIASDMTLDGRWRVDGDLVVPAGVTLTIRPGAELSFEAGVEMTVRGRILAAGEPDERIRLIGANGSLWDGIHVRDSLEDNIFSYVDIADAQSSDGSIGAFASVLTIDNMTFAGSRRHYVRVVNASAVIRNSIFPDRFGPDDVPGAGDDNTVEMINGTGIMTGGQMIIEGNTFGTNKGHNDIIDFSGPVRPSPILQVLNNVFLGTADEMLDLGGDAYVEGNVFMHARRDEFNTSSGHTNVISTGDGPVGATIVLVRNVFYDIEHVIDLEDAHLAVLEHNTIVGITPDGPDPGNGTPQEYSAVNLVIVNRNAPGRGAHLEGNIIVDVPERIFGEPDTSRNGSPAAPSDLLVNNTLLPSERCSDVIGQRPGTIMDLGTNILCGDPLFVDPAGDFHLLPGSPAIGAGVHGLDLGAFVPAGATLSDGPALTFEDFADFTVDGPGIVEFRYRLDGDPWGDRSAVDDPIELTDLADGPHQLEVIGRNYAGVWQDEADAVLRSWTIDSTLPHPVAVGDSYSTDEDVPLIVNAATGVLANDFELPPTALTAVLSAEVQHGTLDLNSDGSFTYTPELDFFGSDTFTYLANDGLLDSQPATVTITVVPQAPVATDDSYGTDEDNPLAIAVDLGVLANDSDGQSDPLMAVLVDGTPNGELTLNSDGSFTYTPNENFFGLDSFRYRASDGRHESASTLVQITVDNVNDPPVAVDDSYTTSLLAEPSELPTYDTLNGESGSFRYIDQNYTGAGDTTRDLAPLTGGRGDLTDGIVAHGNWNVVSSPYVGWASVDPTIAFAFGEVVAVQTVRIHVDNSLQGGVALPQLARISISGQEFEFPIAADSNPAPRFIDLDLGSGVIAAGLELTLVRHNGGGIGDKWVMLSEVEFDFGSGHILDSGVGVLANDGDVDGDELSSRLVDDVTSGTLDLAVDGSISYAPLESFVGLDRFTYRADDGQELSNVATVTIEVGSQEDATTVVDDAYAATAGQTLTVDVDLGVLTNDLDPHGDPLAALLVDPPQHGELTLEEDGSISYTPEAGFVGTDTFTYRASDGTSVSNLATVSINVESSLPADLTGNGFVDFEDLTVLLANWNRNVSTAEGNLVNPDRTPVNFEDLTVLLAAWTGPGPAASPQPAAEAIVQRDTTTTESRTATNAHFDRLGRRDHASLRRANRTSSRLSSYDMPLRRLQAVAVDRAMAEESIPDRERMFRRRAGSSARH